MATTRDKSEAFLQALSDKLAIPDERYEQAVRSYTSLGEWFHRSESTIRKYNPEVYAQGSFRLGTAIRPHTDAEAYDIDSVCELGRLNKTSITQAELKKIVGTEIHSYHKSRNIKKPVIDNRRCWTLEYADEAQFHMDVLPSLPDGQDQRSLLRAQRLDTSWADTSIAITDKEEATFRVYTVNWPRSNPKGFAAWFRSKMSVVLEIRKMQLVEALKRQGVTAGVEEIQDYRVRTPLQTSVMILKRHRDMMFVDDPDIKPISIIITTLAAHAYGNHERISDALLHILTKMRSFVHWDGERYVIPNPTDPLENFADKWEEEPEKAKAFFAWLDQAQRDFQNVAKATELSEMRNAITARMGDRLTQAAVDHVSGLSGKFLRSATVAPASLEPTFGNSPRTPKTPKGFA